MGAVCVCGGVFNNVNLYVDANKVKSSDFVWCSYSLRSYCFSSSFAIFVYCSASLLFSSPVLSLFAFPLLSPSLFAFLLSSLMSLERERGCGIAEVGVTRGQRRFLFLLECYCQSHHLGNAQICICITVKVWHKTKKAGPMVHNSRGELEVNRTQGQNTKLKTYRMTQTPNVGV